MDWSEGFEIGTEGGFARAWVRPGPTCPHCGGVGRREVILEGAPRIVTCRCQRVVDRVARFNLADIPARHAACSMDTFRRDLPGAEPGWRATRIWLDRFVPGQENPGLVLYGAPGRGKTHLLVAALRELVFRYGVAVRFVEFTHLLAAIKEGFDRKAGEATTLTPLVRVPVLAVDELGKGRKTDFELATIDEIVSRRYNARGTLLGTTNFPLAGSGRGREGESLATGGLETLSERLGERVFSRLAETVTFAPALGEDFRATRGR